MRFYGSLNVKGDKCLIALDANPNKENPYSGWISYEKVSNNVKTTGQALFFNSSLKVWDLAKSNQLSTMPCRAISLNGPDINGNWAILRFGSLYTTKYHWLGTNLYISDITPGEITNIKPTNIGSLVQIIGYSKSDNIGFFDFCPTYIEIG